MSSLANKTRKKNKHFFKFIYFLMGGRMGGKRGQKIQDRLRTDGRDPYMGLNLRNSEIMTGAEAGSLTD